MASPVATLGSKFLFHSVFNTSPESTAIRMSLTCTFIRYASGQIHD